MSKGGCDPSCVKPEIEQASGITCGPAEGEVHTGAGVLAGAVTLWGPTLEWAVPEGLHSVKKNHAGTVCKELQAMGRNSY